MSHIVAVKLYNGCSVITLCMMPHKIYVINIECVMSEVQALCDVTHIVNVISYTVDDTS